MSSCSYLYPAGEELLANVGSWYDTVAGRDGESRPSTSTYQCFCIPGLDQTGMSFDELCILNAF
jgi:hypothetical protein